MQKTKNKDNKKLQYASRIDLKILASWWLKKKSFNL